MRGNQLAAARSRHRTGSIPACAGEPSGRRSKRSPPRVYPRVCGGTVLAELRPVVGVGLSPRVRGNRMRGATFEMTCGSIPACAGEPFGGGTSKGLLGVYPRVCGGTSTDGSETGIYEGLSPRVRGNPLRDLMCSPTFGSIPACAGEPRSCSVRSASLRVYPRVCGGTHHGCNFSPCQAGLSPRVRGNPPQPRRFFVRPGSIPACAGEPATAAAIPQGDRVYPRVCGGTRSLSSPQSGKKGLSPRVRGNL